MFKWLRKTSLWIVALPLLCFFLGAGANQLVLAANHDRFPVMVSQAKLFEYEQKLEKYSTSEDAAIAEEAKIKLEELEHGYLDEVHVVMTDDTHLNWLADWIDLGDTYSLGDLLIELGEIGLKYSPTVWVVVVLSRLNKREDYEEDCRRVYR